MNDSVQPTADRRREGGVTVFIYRQIATTINMVRRNDLRQNLLLLLVAAYLIIGLEILSLSWFNADTAKAIVANIQLSDVVLTIPAVTLGPWVLTLAALLSTLAFGQFLVNGLLKRSELTRSRQASLAFFSALTAGAVVVALLDLPLVVVAVFMVTFVIIAAGPPRLSDRRTARAAGSEVALGSRDHQTIRVVSLRAVIYAVLFGVVEVDTETNPANLKTAHDLIGDYFDSSRTTYRLRQTLGLLVLFSVSMTFFLSIVPAHAWMPAEVISIQLPATPSTESALVSPLLVRPPNAAPGVVGRVISSNAEELTVLTLGTHPRVLHLPRSWVTGRSICRAPGSLWTYTVFSGLRRYPSCPGRHKDSAAHRT